MDAVTELHEPTLTTPPTVPPSVPPPMADPQSLERRREILLDALKTALTDGHEHRLFRSGRLDGLFPSKLGDSGEAARQALAASLLEHVRTEVKGKFIFEWVKATPRAVGFVAEHDSPKAILRELRDAIGETQNGVPVWLEQARSELRAISGLIDQRSTALLNRLESLAGRMEAALRRAEVREPAKSWGHAIAPWVDFALNHLDQRREGRLGACPLSELFHVVHQQFNALTIPEFHDGIRRLADVHALILTGGTGEIREPEFAILFGGKLNSFAER